MSEKHPSPHLSAIKLLAAIAWADGEIQKEERAGLERILLVAVLEPGEREQAEAYIRNPTDLDLSEVSQFDVPAREGIYRAAVRSAASDGSLHPSEAAMLLELRKGLEIDDSVADLIESESFPDGMTPE